MKPMFAADGQQGFDPAAFRRLCVETALLAKLTRYDFQPPSGGCVLKQ